MGVSLYNLIVIFHRFVSITARVSVLSIFFVCEKVENDSNNKKIVIYNFICKLFKEGIFYINFFIRKLTGILAAKKPMPNTVKMIRAMSLKTIFIGYALTR